MNSKLIVAIALLLLVIGCGKTQITGKTITGEVTKLEPIKLGAILPMTGTASFLGEPEMNGILLAQDEINARGGINGRPLEIIFEDSQSLATPGVNAANKLINIDDVDLLFTSLTGVSGALAPFAQANNKVIIYESTTTTFAKPNDLVFVTYPNADDLCRVAAELAIKEGKKRFALIGLAFEATYDCENGIKKATEGTDAELIFFDKYDYYEKDFRTSLLKAKEESIDAIFPYTYTKNNIPLFHQLLDLQFETTLVCPLLTSSCTTVEEAEMLAANTDLFEDALGTDTSFNVINPEVKSFVEKYKARFGKLPDANAALPYDDMMLIKKALEKCDEVTTECIREKLLETQLTGVTGSLVFDSNGVAKRAVSLKRFDGEWVDY